MAKVRMRHYISGGRGDGSEWPHRGGILECGEAEAADLIRGQLADPVIGDATEPAAPVSEPVVSEPPAPAEDDATSEGQAARENGSQRDDSDSEPEDPASPAVRAAKQVWIDHAIAQGFDANVAASMTKADLIAQFGSGVSA